MTESYMYVYLKLINFFLSLIAIGLVPLHNSSSYGHLEVSQMLIKYGANVNALDLWKVKLINPSDLILILGLKY